MQPPGGSTPPGGVGSAPSGQQQGDKAPGQTPEQLQQQKQAEGEAKAETERRAARAEAIRRLEELNAWRLEPLGMDRRFNRYWLLCCPDFSVTSAYTGAADDFPDSTNNIPGVLGVPA